MDEKQFLTLRIIWGAVTFSTILFFGVLALVVAPAGNFEYGEDFPVQYVFLGIALTCAAAFYMMRSRRSALSESDNPDAKQEFILRIVCFALAEAVGLIGGVSSLFQVPATMSLGLLGIALVMLAMEFPKPR
jgi:uncharacterized membrane protein YfcA